MKELHMSQQAFDELSREYANKQNSFYNMPFIESHNGMRVFVSPHLPFKRKKEMPKNKIKRFWRWFRVRVLRRNELLETVHCIEYDRMPVSSWLYFPITMKSDLSKNMIV